MSADDCWILWQDGKLILHTENDGPRYMRRGAEPREREVTIEELRGHSRLYGEALKLIEEHRLPKDPK